MSETSITTDTDEQVAQIAAGLGKSESELRATLWERIAAADLPADIDAEEIYESVVGDIYEDAVNQGEESTATARASATTDDSESALEKFGTGLQGDTRAEEYREREEDIETMSEAFSRAMDGKERRAKTNTERPP